MFSELVESVPTQGHTKKPWTLAVSALFQCVCLGVLLLIPLLCTQALPKIVPVHFVATPLASSPIVSRPASPAPPSRASGPVLREYIFSEPASIPPHARETVDDVQPPLGPGSPGAIVPGGGDSLPLGPGSTLIAPPPVQPAPPPRQRIQIIGGSIEQAKLISQVQPVYPALARVARIQGNVILHAIIARDGSIAELQVVSGYPLLIRAALDAVRQWRYRPTLLDGAPVEVDTTITVSFTMQR